MSNIGKLRAFVALDFKTIKQYLSPLCVAIFVILTALLAALQGTTATSAAIGIAFGVMYSMFPFDISEKNGLDTLYSSLGVERKTVVCGRFLFSFIFDLCAVACAYICGFAGLLVGQLIEIKLEEPSNTITLPMPMPILIFIVAGGFLIFQALQIMFCFKFGFTKGGMYTYLPFAGVFFVFGLIILFANAFGVEIDIAKYQDLVTKIINANLPIIIGMFTFFTIVILILSYIIAQFLYASRDF
jgi:hypothetical protein